MASDPRTPKSELSVKAGAPVTAFVSKSPNSIYRLETREGQDGVVDLCRFEGEGKRCVEIQEDVTKVFALMQKQGFFCSLPFDPSRTWIECERIEKLVERA